jgi:hypothetical protein
MKLAGFFLIIAGCFLALAALVLLRATGLRYAFVLSGIALELAGLLLATKGHRTKSWGGGQ